MFESLDPGGERCGQPEANAVTTQAFFASDDLELGEWGGVVRRRRLVGHLIRWITKVGISEVGASSAVESWGTNVNTDWSSIMSYAIVGFGKIGQALALAFARKNIDVTVASRRPPEALAPQARAIGPRVVPKSLQNAVEADTIIPAIPSLGAPREGEGSAGLGSVRRRSSTRRTRLEFSLKSWAVSRPPPSQ